MISPIKEYFQNDFSKVSRVNSILQPSSFAPGLGSAFGDQGLAQRGNLLVPGDGLSRSNLALPETMKAGREASAFRSSRMAPTAGRRQNDFFFDEKSQEHSCRKFSD
jgi:hypothetical protein